MKRLKQISEQIKESINQFIETAENQKSPIEKTIFDMKKRILEAKKLAAVAIAEAQMLKRTYQEAVDTAEMWRKKADDASQNGDTDRSTAAQQREQQHLQRANDLEQQIHAQEAVVADLKTALKEFYQQFRNAVKRAKTLLQRQKQAETTAEFYKTTTEFYKLLAEFDLPDDNVVFQQAEQEVKETEAEAKMWKERNRRGAVQPETSKDNSNLDEVLAALKDDILGSSQND